MTDGFRIYDPSVAASCGYNSFATRCRQGDKEVKWYTLFAIVKP